MSAYTWLIIGAILISVELATGTIYLLMLGVATVPAWIVERMGGSFLAQTITYLICAAVLVTIVRRIRQNRKGKDTPNAADDLDAGGIVHVSDWQDGVGRTHYRDSFWQVSLEGNATAPVDGKYRIVRLDGTQIIVTPL